MRNSFIHIVLATLLLSGCQPVLERQHVPIWLGIRVEEGMDTQLLARQLDSLKSWGFAGILIEGVIVASPTTDSLHLLPQHARLMLTSGMAAERAGLRYAYQLTAYHPDSVIRQRTVDINQAAWFAGLEGAWLQVLARGLPPSSFISMGSNLGPACQWQQGWLVLQQKLHQRTTTISLSPADAQSAQLLPALSFIGIHASGAPDGLEKPYARQLHAQLGALADSLHKPVFLTHTDLLGAGKLIQLQNHLRFWPENVRLQGIVLNTIYPTPSVLDGTSHFGLATDAELLSWLRAYLAAPQP